MPVHARCAIALLLLWAGCQSKPDPGRGGGPPYPGGYSADLKREVLKYVMAHPPAAPVIHTDPPTDVRNPGLWPFKNKRVYWIYHDRLPSYPKQGFYAALISDPDDVKQKQAWSARGGAPVPTSQPTPPADLLIYQGWIYVTGDLPRVGTRAVIAQATGCAILVYFHPGVNGLKQRVCCLEGDPDAGLWAFSGDGESSYYVPVGSFIELEANADGTFNHWTTDSAGNYVRTVNTIQNDSEHLRVMQAVQAGQYRYEVSWAAPLKANQCQSREGASRCVVAAHSS